MNQNRQWSDTLRYMALTGLAIFLIVVVYVSRGSLSLIISAAIIAYILAPLANFLTNKLRLNRNLSVIISYLILIIIAVLLLVLVIPQITVRIQNFLNSDWPTTINSIDRWIEDLIRKFEVDKPGIGGFSIDLTVPLTELRNYMSSVDVKGFDVQSIVPDLSAALGSIVTVGANVLSRIMGVLLAIITTIMASIHFCRDGWKLSNTIVNQFPEIYRPEIRELLERLGGVWNNYFLGQVKLMLIIGIVTFAVTTALGLKWALLLGIIAGFLEIVPNIGPIVAAVPAIISAAIFGSQWLPVSNLMMVIVVIAAYVLIQQTENAIIVPRIMSEALDLHPVLVILGVLILSGRLGIIGALMAAPILGIIKVLLHYLACKIRKEDPYPEIFTLS